MGLLLFAIVGLIVGVFIGFKMTEPPGGPGVTSAIGLTGGLAGGVGGALLTGANPLGSGGLFGLLGAVAGAIILLALYALIAAPGLSYGAGSSTGSGDATTGRGRN